MLMTPELFLDCILYIINDDTDAARNLVLELVAFFEGDARNNSTADHDITKFYIRVLKAIIASKTTKQNRDELRLILLKFQSDLFLSKRNEIFKLLQDIFMSEEIMSPGKISQSAEKIRNALAWHRCNKATRALYGTLARAGDMVSPLDQATEMRKLLSVSKEIDTALSSEVTNIILPPKSLVEQIDMSDKDSMKTALQKHQERAVKGILRLGLQGLNRMLGSRGGFARGEAVVFYALPHHYKSGMIMSVTGWMALYNKPTSSDMNNGKKPLILLISLENEAYQNFVWMFRHFYETQNYVSSQHLTDEQVADWTYEAFAINGYTLIIERHVPAQFNYPEYVKTVERYENSGYNIVMSSIDYINLMAKDGIPTTDGGRNDLAVTALFSALCNYTKTKGITFVSAHPLKREAELIASGGATNVIKRFHKGLIADAFSVAREVDLEIYIHIERNLDGTAYLTMMRGKHRYVDDTPISHQYCAYRFHPKGIRDDILTAPEYVTDIYSDPYSAEGDRGTPSQPVESEIYTSVSF